jgi:hypothetical protein
MALRGSLAPGGVKVTPADDRNRADACQGWEVKCAGRIAESYNRYPHSVKILFQLALLLLRKNRPDHAYRRILLTSSR